MEWPRLHFYLVVDAGLTLKLRKFSLVSARTVLDEPSARTMGSACAEPPSRRPATTCYAEVFMIPVDLMQVDFPTCIILVWTAWKHRGTHIMATETFDVRTLSYRLDRLLETTTVTRTVSSSDGNEQTVLVTMISMWLIYLLKHLETRLSSMLVKTDSSMVMTTVTIVASVFYIAWSNMLNLLMAAF